MRRLSKRFVDWSERLVTDTDFAGRTSRREWVVQEFSLLYLLLVVFPVSIAFIWLLPSSDDVVVLPALTILFAPLFGVMLGGYFFSIEREPVQSLESALVWLHQVGTPDLFEGEHVVVSSFERQNTPPPVLGWGRLTLTTRRLIFQQPRLRILPPFRPRIPREFDLRAIQVESVESARAFLGMFAGRPPYPILRVSTASGDLIEFRMLAARGWSDEINRLSQAVRSVP